MNKLPTEIRAVWDQHRSAEDAILYGMVCDRRIDGGFTDTYLILSRKRFYILSNDRQPVEQKTFKGFVVHGKDEPSVNVEDWKAESIPVEQLESLTITNLVASGMIMIKRAGLDRAVAAFTNGNMRQAAKLVSLFEKLKKEEEPDSGDLEDGPENSACPKCGMIYPEEGRAICPKCMKRSALFARLLSFGRPYKWSMVLIILFMMLNSATGLVIPYFQGTVLFDQALGDTGYFAGEIGLVIAIIILFRTISLLFGVLFGVIVARISANIVFDLKSSVFTAMQRLSLKFFQKRQTGQLMTRVNNDATELQFFFVDGMPYFIVNAMNIIGIVGVLFYMDWQLTLICLAPMPVVVLLIRWTFPRLFRLSWLRWRRISGLNSIISDTLRGTRVVKAFGKEQREMARFQKANVSYSHAERSLNQMGGTIFPVLSLVTQAGGLAIWAFGGWKVMNGSLTFGEIMSFTQYMFMLYGPIQFMNNIVGWWSNCMSSAQRIFEIQDAQPDVQEKKDAVTLSQLNGDIQVSNVTFGYEPNKPVLKEVSLHAKPGQMIGVVGHSGAGKSTLVNLISRLHDVNDGEVRIDGVNVKDLSFETLRSQIGIVSQEIYVFMGTIAENIAYANPECTVEEIINAAKIANAHEFIEQLPDGYDTIVGSGGHDLSGGEKQRISIARAILHNPKIMILDEATASLDTETELQIQEALESLIKGRTTIAIAHRLSTLRNADYLVVMDGGKVVEAGTHTELMAKEGSYHGMVKKHDEALKLREVV